MSIAGQILGWLYRDEKQALTRMRENDRLRRELNRRAWNRFSKAVVSTSAEREVEVVRIETETDDTCSLRLRLHSGEAFNARPGQFLTCCFNIDGETVRRAYSISSLPDPRQVRITIKQIPEGRVSGWTQKHLKAGDRFTVLGPSGDFTQRPDTQQAVFIAAGVGITPIRPLIEAHLAASDEAEATLIYACRSAKQLIFRVELEALARRFPNLKIHWVLSRPGPSWQGLKGRLDADRLLQLAHEHGRADAYYLCGPDAFIDMGREALASAGVRERCIHTERFLPAAQAAQAHPTTPQSIYFRRSKMRVEAQPGQSILEAGLEAGVPLDYSCQVGGCAHCRVKVAEGTVISDEPNSLSPEEFEQGYRLACLSYACSATEVEA
ncbi:ferredoxin--NADP reductase [Marinobacteraceae bacterium S3BR75-40.1]